MQDLRVKNQFTEHKELKAAQGVKIAAKELEKMREKATQERDQFYAEREKKIAAKKKQALEEQSMTTEATVKSGWEGVVELIELDQSKSGWKCTGGLFC